MWSPVLADDAETVSGRLLSALRRDIAEGTLTPGEKLPTHRDLAHRLGIGLGTVTTVYAEAVRDGLITAQVGRGSFVAEQATLTEPANDGTIRMSQNVPPLAPTQRRFAATFSRLRQRSDLADHLGYAPPEGYASHRRLGAEWLKRVSGHDAIDISKLIVTTGAQQAMTLAFDTLCKPGDTLLCEAATYFGMRSIAQVGGYKLRGVAMDGEGLLPEALDRAATESGAKVLYTLPTLQNPTGRIMSYRRRMDIIEVARKHDIWIVEDDLYSVFAIGTAPPPLAAYAPERCVYINGTSKALAPGLRVGYMVLPNAEQFDAALRLIRARIYSPASLGAMIASQWIEDGTADEVVAEVQAEMLARGAIARDKLGSACEAPADPRCPHLWLPMPEIEAERLAARAMRSGVEITPPSAPLVDAGALSGVRLCIGAVSDRTTLSTAVDRVAEALREREDAVV